SARPADAALSRSGPGPWLQILRAHEKCFFRPLQAPLPQGLVFAWPAGMPLHCLDELVQFQSAHLANERVWLQALRCVNRDHRVAVLAIAAPPVVLPARD